MRKRPLASSRSRAEVAVVAYCRPCFAGDGGLLPDFDWMLAERPLLVATLDDAQPRLLQRPAKALATLQDPRVKLRRDERVYADSGNADLKRKVLTAPWPRRWHAWLYVAIDILRRPVTPVRSPYSNLRASEEGVHAPSPNR